MTVSLASHAESPAAQSGAGPAAAEAPAEAPEALRALYPQEYRDLLNSIPDGYQAGRADAPYGTYRTPVAPTARALQDRLEALEKKVFGLNAKDFPSPQKYARAIFLLENDALSLHLEIVNNPQLFASSFEHQSLAQSSVELYRSLSFHRDRAFEDMVRFIDTQLPGPNGGQFRVDPPEKGGLPLYLPNFRSDTLLGDAERAKAYQEKLEEFRKGGGSEDEIRLLSRDLVKGAAPYQWYEYAELPNGDIRVTSGKAGHIVLGEGGPVKAAGQMAILRDETGRVTMMVLTNGSGSYKPDMISVHKLGERIAGMLQIPQSKIVYTRGEPVTSQFFKIYSKGAGVPKDQIKADAAAMETLGSQLLANCPQRFARIGRASRRTGGRKVVVISAPSGGGKTTLIDMLKKEYPDRVANVVATTTRAPRAGEVNGTHYLFVSPEEFQERVARGEFVEWQQVHGNYYGTGKQQVADVVDQGKVPLLNIDVQGAANVREIYGDDAHLVFVSPPSMKVLEQRLRGRGTDAEEAIQRRLENAKSEMKEKDKFDEVVVNGDLEKAYADFKRAVLGEDPIPAAPAAPPIP